jgi:hypothetical protein
MFRLSAREQLAIELVLSAGEPLGREEVGNGPVCKEERGFITAMASVELGLLDREWEALERWTAWLVGGLSAEDELVQARLCEDCERLGWDLPAPTGIP